MFNPGMMGGMMGGQLPQLPTTQELWKDEKSKYRHWMILFFIGILVVVGMMIAGIVLTSVQKDAILDDQIELAKSWPSYNSANNNWQEGGSIATAADLRREFSANFTSRFIIMPSISAGFVGVGLLLFVASLFESYKVKSFAKLSSWPTFVVGFGAFMAFFQLMSLAWSANSGTFDTESGPIIGFVANLSTLVVYFGGGMQVSRIRKQFVMSDRIEKMKSNPQFQAAQQQAANMMGGYMGGMGPYAPQNMAPQGTPAPQAPVQPAAQPATPAAAAATTATPAQPAKPSERQKLEAMSVTDLKKIAKKLSISGSSDMKKDELIENILRIHEGKK